MIKNRVVYIFPIIAIIVVILLTIQTIKRNNNEEINNYNKQDIKQDFNIKLIKEVNKTTKINYLISPYSIEIALNMLKVGAKGNTLKEIENLIGNRKINNLTIKDRVSVANAAFIKKEYKEYILDSYINTLNNNYNSELLYDEFKTPKVINDWVNNKTNGMIDKILDDIDKEFVLGLANALAIDVEWNTPFECTRTTNEKFTKKDGKSYETEMMHKILEDKSSKYLKNDNATGVIISYKNYNSETGEENSKNDNTLEFIGILPNDNIDNYIDNLTDDELNNLLFSAKNANDNFSINLSLPRFKYDYEIEDFIDVLKNLGINNAFDKEKADFSNIISKNIESLYVGEAIHKTHIDLNEKGTKAAAVTYFGMFKNTMMPKEKEIVNIEFNKPFIYIIRDKETKEMLFFGTVYAPNEWNGSTCSENN